MIAESIKVRAYEFKSRKFVGEYENCAKAAKELYMRYGQQYAIHKYSTSGVKDFSKKRGILSKKTGIRYHFEKVK